MAPPRVGVRVFKIVDPVFYNKLLEDRNSLNSFKSDSLISAAVQLKNDISEILQTPELSADQRVEKFESSLRQRMTSVLANIRNNIRIGGEMTLPPPTQSASAVPLSRIGGGGAEARPPPPPQKCIGMEECRILHQLPPNKKARGAHILYALIDAPNINIDKLTQTIYVGGKKIPGLNVVDVIQEMLVNPLFGKKKKSVRIASGMSTLLRELARSSSLGVRTIANPVLRAEFEKFRTGDSQSEVASVEKTVVENRWLHLT